MIACIVYGCVCVLFGLSLKLIYKMENTLNPKIIAHRNAVLCTMTPTEYNINQTNLYHTSASHSHIELSTMSLGILIPSNSRQNEEATKAVEIVFGNDKNVNISQPAKDGENKRKNSRSSNHRISLRIPLHEYLQTKENYLQFAQFLAHCFSIVIFALFKNKNNTSLLLK